MTSKQLSVVAVLIFIVAFMVPLMVSGLKGITNVPCPKNIVHYGGNHPYVTVLKKYPQYFRQGKKMRCYPAGHASGGFALLSLFFLFKKRKNKIIAFLSVMTLGWSIGIYKMLIGDHFLSHTVVTMWLAWLIILIISSDVQYYFNCKYSQKILLKNHSGVSSRQESPEHPLPRVF